MTAAAGANEFDFTAKDFQAVARIALERAGISLNESKKTMVYARLSKRLRAHGFQNFSQYLNFVDDPGNTQEMSALIAALTTNVTAFFREGHHFEYLRLKALPPLIQRAKMGDRIRLWSSACSTGEEPYSMAMTIFKLCPEAPNLDIRILATDVNEQVVEKARAGQYPTESQQQVPGDLRTGSFVPVATGEKVEISHPVRSLITFNQLNLFEPWPFKGKFDIIFCRNVAIYFDKPTQEKLWAALADRLHIGGHLFIGHSERISGRAATHLNAEGVTHYTKANSANPISEHPNRGSAKCH